MQHFHGVRSRCARMIRCTIASPIRFSILTSLTTVLREFSICSWAELEHSSIDIRGDEELVFDVDEVFGHLDGCGGVSGTSLRREITQYL